MLKNITKIISPELLKILSEMGHGDEIVIADANFPCETCGKRVIRADGISGNEMLKAILNLIPLDQYSSKPVALMKTTNGDKEPEIWKIYEQSLIDNYEKFDIEYIERFAFYERAKKAFAVIATGEEAIYANVIIKKGVIQTA